MGKYIKTCGGSDKQLYQTSRHCARGTSWPVSIMINLAIVTLYISNVVAAWPLEEAESCTTPFRVREQ